MVHAEVFFYRYKNVKHSQEVTGKISILIYDFSTLLKSNNFQNKIVNYEKISPTVFDSTFSYYDIKL